MRRAKSFMGYYRPDGRVGVRNHVIVIGNCSCANGIVSKIAKETPGTIPMIHTDGCSAPGEYERWRTVLTGVCGNPNIYASVLIGVGCETDDAKEMAEIIRKETGKPIFAAIVQDDGGGQKVIELGIKAAHQFVEEASKVERKEAPMSVLVFGTECGGSDALSGVTANPAIGYVSDWVVANGGTSLLSETAELIGTEDILAKRSINKEVGDKVKKIINDEAVALREVLGIDVARSLARGNMDGGLTTIQEKSLGCVKKGGTSPVMDVIEYGEQIGKKKGLVVMNGPGYDPDSLTGLFASGAQVFMFSTGRGNPLGYPVAPCIKICSNTKTYLAVGGDNGDMDINAGAIITEGITPTELGESCIDYLIEVINGKETRPEANGYGGAMCVYSTTMPM